jgi:hypothetical protein
MSMPRPKWVPKTAEQREAIEAVTRAAAATAEAADELRAAVAAADALGVPRSHLADAADTPRTTFYRRLGAWGTDRSAQA